MGAVNKAEWWAHYTRYLRSPEWRARRAATLARDGGCCRCCGARAAQVHHQTYARVGEERPEDLISLCARCHKGVHEGRSARTRIRTKAERERGKR
jgi:5-methylcytosine-specific restriction endonuclease McrA